MPGLKVGLASEILNARYSPTAVVRANYLTAVASCIDSLWVPDHLNSLILRAIATPQYLGGGTLIPKIDTSPPATGSGGCDRPLHDGVGDAGGLQRSRRCRRLEAVTVVTRLDPRMEVCNDHSR
jgi:hypothetical protein